MTEAWVTLATNDSYALGALVLAHSLKRANTSRQTVVMITNGVTTSMKDQLERSFDHVEVVDVLSSDDAANLALLNRPELAVTFTKLHCWRLTRYTKCVFMDADTLVLENCDELFQREELSAAPDVGWPDCFNSGVFVFRPSEDTYAAILQLALTCGTFDGGDQGLLNEYFSGWATEDIRKHLPFIYNAVSAPAAYTYLPAFKRFGDSIKIIHFLGSSKPWTLNFNSETREVHVPSECGHLQSYLNLWWSLFQNTVLPQLSEDAEYEDYDCEIESRVSESGHAAYLISLKKAAEDEAQRKMRWEQGQADYLGEDSFANIQAKLESALREGSPRKDVVPVTAED